MLSKYKKLKKQLNLITELAQQVTELQKSVGDIAARLDRRDRSPNANLQDHEFKVFSQWGEDGIIQYLIHEVDIPNTTFVEFGVQDYRESNTRFLLQHDNWSGLIIDASAPQIAQVKAESIYYRNDLRAVCAFIDRDNIDELIRGNGVSGDIGLLSIDIDGNDYWVWEAITCVNPRIVICEYDSLLGDVHRVSTPYDKNFVRTQAHYSFLYGGASIRAMEYLGEKKGYALVGSNSAGNNLFFVRRDVLGRLPALSAKQAYVKARFRNSHDREGHLTFLRFDEALEVIKDLPLVNVETNAALRVADIIKRQP
jgi:hypothetical protein